MQLRVTVSAMVFALVGVLATNSVLADDAVKLPEKVGKALNERYEGVKVLSCKKVRDIAPVLYKIKARITCTKCGVDAKFDIHYTAAGELYEETRHKIKPNQLPSLVEEGVKKWAGDSQILEASVAAEKPRKGRPVKIEYEVKVLDANGKKFKAKFNPRGRNISKSKGPQPAKAENGKKENGSKKPEGSAAKKEDKKVEKKEEKKEKKAAKKEGS